MNKKGQSFFDVMIFMVFAFLLVIGFGIFIYVFGQANALTSTITTPANSIVNITAVFNQTFGELNNGLQSLRYVAFAILFGMIVNILLSNFLVKNHPAFFFLYLGITILAVILSAFISNSASTIINNPIFASTFANSMPEGTFILNYLPIWVAVIGFFGGVILYIGITRDEGTGGF